MADNKPIPFGYKTGWLAVSSTDREALVAALGLSNPRDASWQEGIDAVYKSGYSLTGIFGVKPYKVFVSPSVDRWTLVVSDWMAGTGSTEGASEIEQLITQLSTQFGEVQAFSTYRVIGYEHWMLARNGTLLRSFVHAEDGYLESGEPTPIECSFGWYPIRPASEDEENAEEAELDEPDEEAVMTVAGDWSVNPSQLSSSTPSAGLGILATAPPARQTRQQDGATAQQRPWWRFW